MTSASPAFATVNPAAPCSTCIRPSITDLCVLVCGRRRRPRDLAYSAIRATLRRTTGPSIRMAGVGRSGTMGGALYGTSAQRPTRVRYPVMAFLCALSFLTYFDRVCISRAQGDIHRDLGLSDT